MGSDSMDPFNIVGAVFAASKIVWDVVVFWKDAPDAPEEASESGPLVAMFFIQVCP